MYRAGSWWARAYAPELSMGLHTSEEIRDVIDAEKLDDGTFAVKIDELRDGNGNKAQVIDAETGEIAEIVTQQNHAAAESPLPEVVAPPVFDINAHNLATQTGTKEAVKALCAVLAHHPEEARASIFVTSGGMQIISVLGRHGIGSLKSRFTDLGVILPQEEVA
jgi:hypothetical protein